MLDLRTVKRWATRTARLLIGIPDYDAYVAQHKLAHPDEPAMSYEEFFRDRQKARYAFDKGKIRGCS